jgi:hypothetical protein
MVYPAEALFFLSLTALKNIHLAMAMLIFLCLARNKPASPPAAGEAGQAGITSA